MSSFKYSSPGKIILFGEHAVVYGEPAIATAISKRTFMKCDFRPSSRTVINLVDNGSFFSFNPKQGSDKMSQRTKMLYSAFRNFPDNHALDIEIKSDFPTGMGMGSSASFCSLIATAGLRTSRTKREITKDAIFEETKRLENYFHYNGSGLDPATVVYGGVIKMERRRIVSTKSFGSEKIPLLIVDSMIERSTYESVKHVAELLKDSGAIYQPIIRSLGGISKNFYDSNEPKSCLLRRYFPLAQRLLECLDLSNSAIDRIVRIAKENGLCAKISGAGMGGIVLVSGSDIRRKGDLFKPFRVISAEIGAEGIREE